MLVAKNFDSIEFPVKYSISDYYLIMVDHVPNAILQNKKLSAFSSLLVRKIVPTIACAMAILNGKLKPTYHFSISPEGVRRSANATELLVTWDQVKRVRKYNSNFFIELDKGGAMSLPYRFLSDDHRAKLDMLFASE